MIALVLAHPLVYGFAAFWLLSAIVSGMPEPSPISSVAYTWFFHSVNILFANLNSFVRERYPRMPLPPDPEDAPLPGAKLLVMPSPTTPNPPQSA